MKCPKCGYNSFDYLDSCKKCGKDLVEFKQRFGIKSVLFPGATGAAIGATEEEDLLAVEAPELAAATAMGATAAASAETDSTDAQAGAEGDDFGFDFMGESSEEEDLSFDELFEEAPEEEDVEESLEAPRAGSAGGAQAATADDFAFDVPDEDDDQGDDFGLDSEPAAKRGGKSEQAKGSGEGPSDPFDLPESSPAVETPEVSPTSAAPTVAAAAVGAGAAAAYSSLSRSDSSRESSSSPDEEDEYVFDHGEVDAEQVALHIAQESAEEPDEVAAKVYSPLEVMPASVGGRFASFVYDGIILALIGLSFLVAAEVSLSRETGPLPTLDTLIDMSVPYFLILFAVAFGYFTLFHFLAGQTPGKMLISLRVETTDGESLSFSQAFLRSVGGLLQLIPFGLGYLLILFSSDGRGWSDRLAGTRVVLATEKK